MLFMRLIKIFSFVFIFVISIQGFSQSKQIQILHSGNKISLRGLSVVNDDIIWVSGNNGMIGKSINGGNTFEWIKVKGFEKRDFRDIEAFDKNTAIIMGVDAPAIILKTLDGGKNWKKVLEDSTKGMFLDAMDFSDSKNGVVIGDPIDQRVYLSSTKDQGETWQKLDPKPGSNSLKVKTGEAFFASSGTNIKMLGKKLAFVSGGLSSRFYYLNSWDEIPMLQGKESTGANSIAMNQKMQGIIVGGDFMQDTNRIENCVLFEIGQDIVYYKPIVAPHGYRSCVCFLTNEIAISCGTSGVDISSNGGKNWELISTEGFHVVQKAKKGKSVFLAGSNGRIAKLIF